MHTNAIGYQQELTVGAFVKTIKAVSKFLHLIAGISLTFLMALTLVDILLRGFNRPIIGTYELVALAGAVVIGFSMPSTSLFRQHIYLDFFLEKSHRHVKNATNIITRTAAIALFCVIGWNLIKYGIDLGKSGEVSLTLQIPFYPVAYGIALCCFTQCLVLVCDIIRIIGGEYE